MILFSSVTFLGFRIRVTSNTPSSSFTCLPVRFLKPPTDTEFVTIPKRNSPSMTPCECVTFIG